MIRSATIKVSAAILLLFVAVVSWCFFTERGSKLSLNALQGSFTNLEYQYQAGNLANGIILSNVSWTLKNDSRITADHVSLEWNPVCWRGKAFCLRNAKIDQLTVSLIASGTQADPISLPPVAIPFSLIADNLSINRLEILQPQQDPIEIDNIEFSGAFRESRLIVDSLHLEWLWFQADAQGRLTLNENYPIELQGTVSHIQHREAFPLRSNFNIDGDLLNALLQASVSQPFESIIGGELSFLTRKTPVDLQVQWQQAQLPLKSVNPFMYMRNGNLNLTGHWPGYHIKGTVEASGPELPVAMATLEGIIDTKRLSLNSLHLETLNGAINATGLLQFTQGIEWHTALNVENIEPHRYWSTPRSTISGKALFEGRNNNGQTTWQLNNLDLAGSTGGFPFTITGGLHRAANSTMLLNTIEIRNQGNTLTANGTLSEESDASVFFTIRDPGMFFPALNGDLYGDLKISGNSNSPEITGSATSGRLWYQDFLVANTRIRGILKTAKDDASELLISAESLTNGDHTVRDVSVKLSGSLNNHYLQASFEGEPLAARSIRLSGSMDKHSNWNGTVYKTIADITGQPLILDSPLNITWVRDKQSMAVQPHCWNLADSTVCASKTALIGKEGTLDFTVDQFDLTAITALLPEGVSARGTLRSKGNLKWHSFQRPQADVFTTIHHGQITFQPSMEKKPLTLNLKPARLVVATQHNKITSKLRLDSDKTGPLDANIDIHLNNRQYPLSGQLKLSNAPVNWIREYFPEVNLNKGMVSSTLQLGGTLKEPSIEGQFKLTDGSLRSAKVPIPLDNIQIDIAIANNDIVIQGNAKSNGQPLSVNGTAHLNSKNWMADLNLTGDKIEVNHKFLDSAIVSPELNVVVAPNSLSVNGRINIPLASINLPKLENTGIPVSDDIVIVDAVAKDDFSVKTTNQTINADIDIELGRQVSFQGYGLDADLLGSMNVAIKPKRNPELLGEIYIDKGTYQSYGQSLIIRDGRINFVGPLEQTTLSVEAIRDTGKILAGLRVNGSLNEPNATLFSEPPLPEEEILPYLVLGRRIDELGATRADDSQLIANAALYMGISNGRNLTQSLAANLGIDEFTMSATGSGEDTQVQLSGRLNDRLLVRYGLGVFNSVNTLFLRYDLAEQLYLETTQGLEKAVDLFYSFEFD